MDKALKQRLVGAIVIIILAVIVLPMLLSGRSDTSRQKSAQIILPSKPAELSFDSRRFPVGDGTRLSVPARQDEQGNNAANKKAAAGNAPASLPPDNNVAAKMPAQPPTHTGRKTAVQPEQLKFESSATAPRYLVQVASFSSEKRANELAQRLQADKLSVLMDVVDREARRFHRVRVGPFADRSQAQAVASQLKQQSKDLSPRVLDLHPDESTPVSTPTDPLVRWVVQVGSFSEQKNAQRLVKKLQLQGYTAFSERVTSVQGSVYKVRIGPEIRRQAAVALAAKLKSEQKIVGLVMTME